MNRDFHNIKDSYKLYKELDLNPIPLSLYLQITNGYMKFLMRRLFETGEIPIPERLGFIRIVGRKVRARVQNGVVKGLAPDWVKTKELWAINEQAKEEKKLVYHFNEETNGIRYRFSWGKTRVLVANKGYYQFIATRKNKRTLSDIIKNGKEYLIKYTHNGKF